MISPTCTYLGRGVNLLIKEVYVCVCKQQMRDEVKAILAEYMPLDNVPSSDQENVTTHCIFL